MPFGAFVRVEEGIEGLVHVSELAERHVEIPEQVVQVNDDVMVKIIDIDLERRRISLSLKQANEGVDATADDFDPTLYGMAASYDDQGNYLYPEGFDPETGEWLEGYEEQRAAWEQQYAEAHARWEAHKKQVEDAEWRQRADSAPSYYSSECRGGVPGADRSEGSLASDEALQALRREAHRRQLISRTSVRGPPTVRVGGPSVWTLERDLRAGRGVVWTRSDGLWSPTGREPATESESGWA